MLDRLIDRIEIVQTVDRISKSGSSSMMRLFQGIEPDLYDAINEIAKNALSAHEEVDSEVHESAYRAAMGAAILTFESYRWACLSLWLDTDFGEYLLDPNRKNRRNKGQPPADSE